MVLRRAGRYEVRDEVGTLVGTIAVAEDRVKAKDATGQVRFKIKRKPDGIKLYNGNEELLWKLKRKDGTRFEIRDAKADAQAFIRGSVLTDVQDRPLASSRVDGADVVLERGGKLVLRVLNVRSPLAVSLLFFDDDVLLRSALLVYLSAVESSP